MARRAVSCLSLLLFVLAAGKNSFAKEQETTAEQLAALPGFKIELVLKADPKVNGSWICLAKDNKGRLLVGAQKGQPVTRVTLQDGKVLKQEDIKLPISETMGLLYAFDSLYVNGMGKNTEGKWSSASSTAATPKRTLKF